MYVVRTFVRLRQLVQANADLARNLAALRPSYGVSKPLGLETNDSDQRTPKARRWNEGLGVNAEGNGAYR